MWTCNIIRSTLDDWMMCILSSDCVLDMKILTWYEISAHLDPPMLQLYIKKEGCSSFFFLIFANHLCDVVSVFSHWSDRDFLNDTSVPWAGLGVTHSDPIVYCNTVTLAVPGVQTHLTGHKWRQGSPVHSTKAVPLIQLDQEHSHKRLKK